jgi:hypothetical protein
MGWGIGLGDRRDRRFEPLRDDDSAIVIKAVTDERGWKV